MAGRRISWPPRRGWLKYLQRQQGQLLRHVQVGQVAPRPLLTHRLESGCAGRDAASSLCDQPVQLRAF